MNIQELIEAVIELPVDCSGSRPKIDKLTTLELIKLLDEPQKVVVPQFVAEYIEQKKNEDYHLLGAMTEIRGRKNKEIDEWFWDYDDNMDIFAHAWLDGYEVEKEPKYKVKVKNTDDYLNETEVGFHFFNNSKKNKTFTRKELEYSDFAWVLDCPGIELVEVKE